METLGPAVRRTWPEGTRISHRSLDSARQKPVKGPAILSLDRQCNDHPPIKGPASSLSRLLQVAAHAQWPYLQFIRFFGPVLVTPWPKLSEKG